MRRIAILQHESAQGPGCLPDCLAQQGFESELFDVGQDWPHQLGGFAGLVVLGSNSGANDPLSWVDEELGLVRQALARAMGARVARNPWPQIGWHRFWVTPAARALFGGREQTQIVPAISAAPRPP